MTVMSGPINFVKVRDWFSAGAFFLSSWGKGLLSRPWTWPPLVGSGLRCRGCDPVSPAARYTASGWRFLSGYPWLVPHQRPLRASVVIIPSPWHGTEVVTIVHTVLVNSSAHVIPMTTLQGRQSQTSISPIWQMRKLRPKRTYDLPRVTQS